MGGSACQQSAPSVNTNTSEGKGSISSLSVHDLCSSIKPLTRTGSYHVHSHRHRPHYLLFFSMKVKCLLYQNIHLKQNAFPYQPLQMQLRKQQLCAKTLISQHPGFHYFSLFTDVCTAVEHFLYREGPLWYILPAWVQFTYCNGERYSLLVSLMDSSVTNQIFTQALPGMSAQIIPCHPQYSHHEFWSVLLRVNAQVTASSETCVVLSSFWLCTWSVGTWLCGKSKWVAFVPLLSPHCFKWSAEVCLNLRNMLRWFDLIK